MRDVRAVKGAVVARVARWLIRRFAPVVFVAWASVTLLFGLFYVLPGDRAAAVLSGQHFVSSTQQQVTAHRLGLDDPLPTQYIRYFNGVLHGDFGTSLSTGRPVSDMLLDGLPASLRLAFWALVVELLVGVGGACLTYGRRRVRMTGSVLAASAIAVPVFVSGFVLQLVFGVLPVVSGWPDVFRFPVQGIGPDAWWTVIPLRQEWRSVALPALTLGMAAGLVLYRVALPLLVDAESQPYVRAARIRGLTGRRVLVRYVLRTAAAPLLAFLAFDFVLLVGSAVVTESIFDWPGIGGLLATSISRRDVPVVLGVTAVLAVLACVATLVAESVSSVLDQRPVETRS